MEELNKKSLTERDICTKFITSALERADLDVTLQVREEVTFTDDGSCFVDGGTQLPVTASRKKRPSFAVVNYNNFYVSCERVLEPTFAAIP